MKEKLGSPSSVSSFGDEAWYYITARKETVAFFKPKVVQEDVVRISFNAGGVVSNIQTYDKSNGEDITLVKRETPTEGHTMGFFEQILGNLGRFNKPASGPGTSSPYPTGGGGGIPGR